MKNREVQSIMNADSQRVGRLPMNLQFFASKGGSGSDNKGNEDEEEPDDDAGDEDDAGDDSEDTGDGKDGKNNKSGKSGSGKKGGKTFNQEQVNRMMTREKNQGRSAAFRELGIDPNDTKAVAMVKALLDAQKSDEQKELEQKQAANEKQQQAEERALKAECKAEALALGCKTQYVDDVVVLAMAKYDEDADFKTIIEELKTKYKAFFSDGTGDEDDRRAGKRGTGSPVKNQRGTGKKGDDGEKSMGARLAAQRAGSGKSSYFRTRK